MLRTWNVFRIPRQVINITFSQRSVILFMSYCILYLYPLQTMENNTIYTYPGSSYNTINQSVYSAVYNINTCINLQITCLVIPNRLLSWHITLTLLGWCVKNIFFNIFDDFTVWSNLIKLAILSRSPFVFVAIRLWSIYRAIMCWAHHPSPPRMFWGKRYFLWKFRILLFAMIYIQIKKDNH